MHLLLYLTSYGTISFMLLLGCASQRILKNLLKLNLEQHYLNSITLRSFLEKQMHGFVFYLMPIWDRFFCITRKARGSKETGAEQFASNPILTRS